MGRLYATGPGIIPALSDKKIEMLGMLGVKNLKMLSSEEVKLESLLEKSVDALFIWSQAC